MRRGQLKRHGCSRACFRFVYHGEYAFLVVYCVLVGADLFPTRGRGRVCVWRFVYIFIVNGVGHIDREGGLLSIIQVVNGLLAFGLILFLWMISLFSSFSLSLSLFSPPPAFLCFGSGGEKRTLLGAWLKALFSSFVASA